MIYCLHASITKLSHSHQAAVSALLSTELSSFHTTQSKTRWPCGSESIQAMMMQPDQLRVTSWSSTFCSHKQQLLSELSLELRSRTTVAHHRVSPRAVKHVQHFVHGWKWTETTPPCICLPWLLTYCGCTGKAFHHYSRTRVHHSLL